MVPMTNTTDVDRRVRRGAKLYEAEPGETIDVYRRDVPRLEAAGFAVVDEETSDEGTPDDGTADEGETPLADRSADELRELAREREVEGRSTMTKAELVSALAPTTQE